MSSPIVSRPSIRPTVAAIVSARSADRRARRPFAQACLGPVGRALVNAPPMPPAGPDNAGILSFPGGRCLMRGVEFAGGGRGMELNIQGKTGLVTGASSGIARGALHHRHRDPGRRRIAALPVLRIEEARTR
jgi:hypothetical protein